MFKNIDKKFEDIGFMKISEDEHGVRYERKESEFGYTHVLTILHKKSGNHIVQSYDKDLFDVQDVGNTCVGLTYKELVLIAKKMRQMGYHR